jgi:hypothetical protein
MKKILAIVLTLAMVLGLSTVALAETEVNTVISANSLTVVEGGTVDLSALTTITGDNVGQVEVKFVSDTWGGSGVTEVSSPSVDELPANITGGGGSYSGTYNGTAVFDSKDLDVGKYEVTYEIQVKKQKGSSANYDYWLDKDEEDITVISVVMTVYVLPMAAPNVAEIILYYNNVSARYGNKKAGGNYIKDVAALMGDTYGTTVFMGQVKEIWDDGEEMYISNPAYRQAVYDYLVLSGLSLDMPTDQYFVDWF